MNTHHNDSVSSFSQLLESGDISEALQFRLSAIENAASHYRQELEAAKVSSLALCAVGIFLSASPLIAVVAGLGLVGYGYVLYKDFQATNRFCLLPLVRKGAGDLMTGIGLASYHVTAEDDPLLNVIGYVDTNLAHEYELVMCREGQLCEFLSRIAPEKRLGAYRHILRHTKVRSNLKLPTLQEIDAAVAIGTTPSQIDSFLPVTNPIESDTPNTIEVEAQPVETITNTESVSSAVVAEPKRNNISITVTLFDFSRLRTEPDKFAHLRVIGGTGIGKTTFVDWLLDILGGDRFVITPKKKAWNWVGLKVYGLWFDYETIRSKLQWIHSEMYRRYPLMEQGETFPLTNFVVDEWRLINNNVKSIKDRDPETKQTIEIAPSAKAMMKDIITVAREASLRLIALAQGENVASWGFEGESDLEECFTDIRLGEFAIDYAKSLRNQCRKDSDDYDYWTAVLNELDLQQSRRTREGKSIPCCMVGKYPARIPDLTDWKRTVSDTDSVEIEQSNLIETDPSTPASQNDTIRDRKLPDENVEADRKPDGISLEAFSARVAEALRPEASDTLPALLDGLDRDGKLLMLRLLLSEKLGKEKTILLAWRQKSGGRNHEKYQYASELLDLMIRDLNDMGFNETNNWGIPT